MPHQPAGARRGDGAAARSRPIAECVELSAAAVTTARVDIALGVEHDVSERQSVDFNRRNDDGLIVSDPAVYARLPKVHRDECRTQGLDRLELIRFLQVAQTITVHPGALAYLLGGI